jgi:predicted molibdopterin-dependent oxidoreductase YjgC
MKTHKDNPLLFINTFLRRDSEPRVTEERYREAANGNPNVYDLRWQVRVRNKFFNLNTQHGN